MNFKAKTVLHKGTSRIAVYFKKNASLIARIKTFEDARWSASKKYWHLPDTDANRLHFKLPLAQSLNPNDEGKLVLRLLSVTFSLKDTVQTQLVLIVML